MNFAMAGTGLRKGSFPRTRVFTRARSGYALPARRRAALVRELLIPGFLSSSSRGPYSARSEPTAVFHGTVSQVRINPQTLNNVVTYDVVVFAGNAQGKLLPGMTANASINVASAPNAADGRPDRIVNGCTKLS